MNIIINKLYKLFGGGYLLLRKIRFVHKYKIKAKISSLELRMDRFIKVNEGCVLGKGCRFLCWNKYMSGKSPQDLSPSLTIGKNFHASRNCVIQCAGTVEIGDDVLFGSDIFVIDFNHGMDANSASYLECNLDVQCVHISDGVWIGNNAIILPGVEIGKKSIVAAGSVVTHDVPAYSIVAGNPARPLKYWNHNSNSWERYRTP